jgi:hypothetical protein
VSETPSRSRPGPQSEDETRAVLERAHRGHTDALGELRAALDQHPEIWQSYGDVARHAPGAWIGLIAGSDLAWKESLGRQVESMRAELAGPAPSPLEALLVARIVACWLQASYADAAVAQAGPISLRQADYARKRQDSAHRRYLMAIGSLATTRRLLGSAAGSPGRGSMATSPSAGPGQLAGSGREVQEPGNRETNQVKGDSDERGLVLEFGPPREGAVGGQKTGGRRKPKVS